MIKQYYFGWYEKDEEKGWCWQEVSVAGESRKAAFASFKEEYGEKLYRGMKEGTVAQGIMVDGPVYHIPDSIMVDIKRPMEKDLLINYSRNPIEKSPRPTKDEWDIPAKPHQQYQHRGM